MSDAFKTLSASIAARAAAEPDVELDEGEMEPAKKPGNDLAWVKRVTTSLFRHFAASGKDARAAPLLTALVQLEAEPVDGQ